MTQSTELNEKELQNERIELQDIIFLAIMSGLITLANFFTVPIVVAIPLVGVRMLVAAFPQGLLFTVGVLKVRKFGSIFILAALTGLALLPISWIITGFNLISGAICEIIVFLIFRNFKKDSSVVVGASLFNPLTIPAAFFLTVWAAESIAEYIANPFITCIMFVLCLIVSLIGSLCGLKIGDSLKKAGKIS